MFLLLLFISLILGLFVGSFLNVVIYRYNTGRSSLVGRSHCPVCNKQLSWLELIPILSFLVQKGKCRSCGGNISTQYPAVEIMTAILFGLVFVRQSGLYSLYASFSHGLLYSTIFLFFYFFIVSILLVIAVYDGRHKIIPEPLVYWFIGLSLCKLLFFLFWYLPVVSHISPFAFPYVYDLFAPVIFFLPFWFLWFVSKGTWIGFGDAKLAFGIGALLGFVSGASAIVLGFWIGAAVAILLLLIERIIPGLFGHLHGKSEIPLGPFLILGLFIVLFSHIDVLGIAAFFQI